MRKPDFYLCENKRADQLCTNCTADERLCFRYSDSTIPALLIPKFQATSHLLWLCRSVCVGHGENPGRLVFLRHGSCGAWWPSVKSVTLLGLKTIDAKSCP